MKNNVRFPAIIAAADWSVDSRNRRIVLAHQTGDGQYMIDEAPGTISSPPTLLADLQKRLAGTGSILPGLDLPIGLPREYAKRSEERRVGKEGRRGWWAEE